MRWESDKSTTEHEIYHLFEGKKKLLTLIYNPFSNAARIECEQEKRVFLIRLEGFRKNKTVIRNEYGMKMGEFGKENGESFIMINDERFNYSLQNNPLAEILLYRDSPENPLVSCGIEGQNGKSSIRFQDHPLLPEGPHPGLLMALSWYMFLPIAKENVAEYAS